MMIDEYLEYTVFYQ